MPRLTKRTVDAARAGDREYIVWDAELQGFGFRVKPSGSRSFMIQYRAKGRTRRFTIGPHGTLTPDEARKEARRLLASVRQGADPAEDRGRTLKAETVAELCQRYLTDYAAVRKKPRSIAEDRRSIDLFVLPAIGRRKVADISRGDVLRLQSGLRNTPYQANRVLALVSKLMNLAEQWGIRSDGTNPCRNVEHFKERSRQRFLSGTELARLGSVLSEVERDNVELPSVVPAIRLLLFTGARLSEILTLRWDYVDLDRARLHLPDSKTGSKDVYLGPPATSVLAAIERVDSEPWVIGGRRPGSHLVNLQLPWRRIRGRAGLGDVRLHDLRHTHASVGAAAGLSLPLIGALLGHTQPATTARYAHLVDDPVKQAADIVGSRIAAMMRPPDEARDNVIALPRSARG